MIMVGPESGDYELQIQELELKKIRLELQNRRLRRLIKRKRKERKRILSLLLSVNHGNDSLVRAG